MTSLVIGVSRLEQLEQAVAAMGGQPRQGGLPVFFGLAKEKHAEVAHQIVQGRSKL